jgi:hypothetical protein
VPLEEWKKHLTYEYYVFWDIHKTPPPHIKVGELKVESHNSRKVPVWHLSVAVKIQAEYIKQEIDKI